MSEEAFYHLEAEQCRQAAADAITTARRRELNQLAAHYEREARRAARQGNSAIQLSKGDRFQPVTLEI